MGAYQYDESSRVTKFSYSIPGVIDSATESFYYNSSSTDKIPDGALTSMAMFSDSWLTYTYDSLSRLSKRDVGNILSESYGYLAGKGTCTTTPLVQDFAVLKKGTSTKVAGWKYTYNALGNITKATDVMTGDYRAYSYDNQGQLQYATDYASSGTAGKRYKYYYDAAGNLTSWKVQNGAATVDLESHTYTYGNSDWKDLLTAFDGHAYSYDTSGNPLSYYNGKQYTMSWRNGRELDTLTVGGKKTSYQYDGNGLRTKKTNPDGSYTQYYIVDGLTVGERWFSAGGSVVTTLRYLYDENRSPVGFGLRNPGDAGWTNFYFAKNLQGDVTAVYRSDASSGSYYGTLVAAYTYDPYGQVLTMVNGEGADVSGNANSYARINPFRYRGYYQDNESGFYYLQSRYYDPEICRFINADNYASTGQDFLGCNMFAYCNNNPVMRADPAGDNPSFNVLKQMADAGYGGGGGGIIIWGLATAVVAAAHAAYHIAKGAVAIANEAGRQTKQWIDEISEKTARKIALETTQSATVIYRYGGTNPGNLTPRNTDINGLSFSLIPPKPGQSAAMTTIGELNATGLVIAIQDRPTHVSVIPIGTTAKGWFQAGPNSIWTQAVRSVVVKVKG